MKTLRIKLFAATLLSASIVLSSCQKEKSPAVTDNTAEITSIDDVYRETMEAGTETKNHKSLGCKVVTRDTTSSPKTITIDFGTGCSDGNGKTKSGQIVISYDNPVFLSLGNNIQVSFVNYRVNSNDISGVCTYHIIGHNVAGNLTMNGTATISTTGANGLNTTIHSNYDYEMLGGQSTLTKEDDQYAASILATGSVSNGDHFDYRTIRPLIKNRASGCNEFYVQGITRIRKNGVPDRFLDYGNGSCDNLAVETVNGVSTNITLD